MSQGNQDRIQQINEEIVRLEKRKGEGVSLQTQEQIDAQIKGLDDERVALEAADQAAEKDQREQSKQAIVSTYVDTLSQMFEAFLPSETFRPLFGLNAYEEKRAQFYQLSQAYTGEAIETQHQKNEELLAAKDERIKALSAQSLADRQQLDESQRDVASLEHTMHECSAKIEELQKQLDAVNRTKDEVVQTNISLTNVVEELKAKLAAAQQPKEEVKPSAKVTDLINQIKSKNDIAPDDFIARWNARQKDESVKLEVPEVPQQELPSASENSSNTSTNVGNNQVLDAAQTVEVPTFQTSEPTDVQGIPTAMAQGLSSEGGASGETPITRAELESRLSQLKIEILSEVTGEKVA